MSFCARPSRASATPLTLSLKRQSVHALHFLLPFAECAITRDRIVSDRRVISVSGAAPLPIKFKRKSASLKRDGASALLPFRVRVREWPRFLSSFSPFHLIFIRLAPFSATKSHSVSLPIRLFSPRLCLLVHAGHCLLTLLISQPIRAAHKFELQLMQ